MAEFFKIPTVSGKRLWAEDIYDIYKEISYKEFNESFAGKYDNYVSFFIEHGILKERHKDETKHLLTTKHIDGTRIEEIDALTSSGGNKNKEVILLRHLSYVLGILDKWKMK